MLTCRFFLCQVMLISIFLNNLNYFKHTKKVQKMKHTSLSPSQLTHSLTDGNILPHLFYVSIVRKQCADTRKPPPNNPGPLFPLQRWLFSWSCWAAPSPFYLFGCAGSSVAVHSLSLAVERLLFSCGVCGLCCVASLVVGAQALGRADFNSWGIQAWLVVAWWALCAEAESLQQGALGSRAWVQ